MNNPKNHPIKSLFLGFLFYTVLSLSLTILITTLAFKEFFPLEIVAGCGLAVFSNAIGLIVKAFSIGKEIRKFFFNFLIVNTAVFLIFLSVICMVVLKTDLQTYPFLTAVFVAYFVMILYNSHVFLGHYHN